LICDNSKNRWDGLFNILVGCVAREG